MDKAQTAKMLAIFKTAYPSFGRDVSPEDMVSLWADMFADVPLDIATVATGQYVATGKFPPTIADVLGIVRQIAAPSHSVAEVWQEAHKLLNSGIPPDRPERAYSKMSPACKAATLSVGGWYALSTSDESDGYCKRAFMKSAALHLEAEQLNAALPAHHGQARIGGRRRD